MIGNDPTIQPDLILQGTATRDPYGMAKVLQGNQEIAIRQRALQLEAQGIPSQIALRQAEAELTQSNTQLLQQKLKWYQLSNNTAPDDDGLGNQHVSKNSLDELQSAIQDPTQATLFNPTSNVDADNTGGIVNG